MAGIHHPRFPSSTVMVVSEDYFVLEGTDGDDDVEEVMMSSISLPASPYSVRSGGTSAFLEGSEDQEMTNLRGIYNRIIGSKLWHETDVLCKDSISLLASPYSTRHKREHPSAAFECKKKQDVCHLRGIYNRIMGSKLLHEDDEEERARKKDDLHAWRQSDPGYLNLQAKDEDLFILSGDPDDDMGGYDDWISMFPVSEDTKKEGTRALHSKDAEILSSMGLAARVASST